MDGEEHIVKWLKVSELEVIVTSFNQTTHYYYDEASSLISLRTDNRTVVYETSIPGKPYPLIKDKSWKYKSNYTLTVNDKEYFGILEVQEQVEAFENVEAGNGETYFCAKVMYKHIDRLEENETSITYIITGHSWISSEVGLVKQESTYKYYENYLLVEEEIKQLLLESIEKGMATNQHRLRL